MKTLQMPKKAVNVKIEETTIEAVNLYAQILGTTFTEVVNSCLDEWVRKNSDLANAQYQSKIAAFEKRFKSTEQEKTDGEDS